MASLAKLTINWTGFIGAPGFTNLYFRNSSPGTMSQAVVDNAATKVDAFVNAFIPMIPNAATLQVDPTVEEIEDSTGNLVAFWTATTEAAQAGTAGGTVEYAAASGACINWYTTAVRDTRRLRGRSFMVPLAGCWDTNGTFGTTDLNTMRAAATALHAATGDSRLVVWGRPRAGQPTSGVSAEVAFATIPDVGAILTSRRQ